MQINSETIFNHTYYIRICLILLTLIGLGLYHYFFIHYPRPNLINSKTLDNKILIEYYNPWAKSVFLRWWSDDLIQPIDYPGNALIFNPQNDFAIRSLMNAEEGGKFRIELPITNQNEVINYEFWYCFTKEVDTQRLQAHSSKLVPKGFPQEIFHLSNDFIFDNNNKLYWQHNVQD